MSCPPLTNKGGKLSISRFPVPCELTLPELAQLDYVVVPGAGSIGDTGIEQEISSYSTTNAGVSPQSKGAAVGKAWDVEMLESQSEARDILEAASAVGNKDTYATRIEWPDGVVEFSIVQVSSPTYVKGAPSGVRIVRYTMVPSIVPIVKNPLQAPVLYAPMYDAPDTVELNWFDLSSIEDGVHVYASYSKIDASALPPPTATLAPNTVQYGYEFDAGEVLEERLYFRVAAFDSDVVKPSNEVSIGNPANVLYPDSPTWLFGNGESGYANTLGLDTLFTDTAGTTPVEEYGDAIALATNLADDGPDMIQATGSERLAWGRMPVVGVRNLCARAGVPSDDFSAPGWVKRNGSISDEGDTIIAPETGQPVPAQRFTLSGGNSQHYISRASFWASGESGGLTAWLVDVSGISNKTVVVFSSQPNRYATFEWTGPQTITSSASHTSAERGFEIVGDYQALVWMRFTGARENAASTTLYAGAYGSYDGDGEYFSVARVQFEFATSPTAYQKVVAPYDVTEPGIPSVNIAYSDTSDDNFSWTLPAGTYHLFIAGEKGCYFDTVVHAGGEFVVGPTTWTGGPANAVTNLIGQRFILVPEYRKDEPFTEFEKEQMVAYAKARGCPHVWNLGAELMANGGPFVDTAGWGTPLANSSISAVDGRLRITRTSSTGSTSARATYALPTSDAGRMYLVAAAYYDGTNGGQGFARFSASATIGASADTFLGPLTSDGFGSAVVPATAAQMYIGLIGTTAADGQYFEGDSFSVRELIPGSTPA